MIIWYAYWKYDRHEFPQFGPMALVMGSIEFATEILMYVVVPLTMGF